MFKRIALLTSLLCTCLSACGGNADSNATYQCPGFTRIVNGTFTRSDKILTWTMELESMPSEFTFNRAAVPDGMLDYAWQINVNADSIGLPELLVTVEHAKSPGESEVTSQDVLAKTQHQLWRIDTAANQARSVAQLDVTLDGKVFTFNVPGDAAPELATVTSPSQSVWQTMYRYGGVTEVCKDTWP